MSRIKFGQSPPSIDEGLADAVDMALAEVAESEKTLESAGVASLDIGVKGPRVPFKEILFPWLKRNAKSFMCIWFTVLGLGSGFLSFKAYQMSNIAASTAYTLYEYQRQVDNIDNIEIMIDGKKQEIVILETSLRNNAFHVIFTLNGGAPIDLDAVPESLLGNTLAATCLSEYLAGITDVPVWNPSIKFSPEEGITGEMVSADGTDIYTLSGTTNGIFFDITTTHAGV